MKKIFTLISVALMAISASAQSETQVFSVGNGDFNTTDPGQAIQVKVGDKACANVAILSSPYPDDMFAFDSYDATNKINVYDESQPIAPWSLEGNAESNTSIAALQDGFTSYMKGKGNPFITNVFEWEYDSDKTRMKLVDVNSTNTPYTPDCGKLPIRGTYVRITPIVKGTFKFGAFIFKGNHPLYVVDEATKTPMAASNIKVSGFFQNNLWEGNFKEEGLEKNEEEKYVVPAGKTCADMVPYLKEWEMPEDYIVQHQSSGNQNRPFMGVFEFSVEAGKSYMIFCPKSQVGFYGFAYTYDKSEFDAADPLPDPETPQGPTTGITSVKAADAVNAPMFNLAGQRVNNGYKGVVIQNGKKFMQK